jgi:hypothetical protein
MKRSSFLIYSIGLVIVLITGPAFADAENSGIPWRLKDAAGTPEWLTISGTHRVRYDSPCAVRNP